MKIHKSSFQQQIHDSTSKSFTPSLFKDVKNLFDKAIETPPSTSLGNKCSLADTCRDFRKFFNTFIPD